MTPRFAIKSALVLAAVSALSTTAFAQEVERPRRRVGFMMSARLIVPWAPQTDFEALLGIHPVSVPAYVLGAQIGDLGVGAGLNFYSREDTTLVLFGPTVSYAVAKSGGGRMQLHVLGSFTFASGSTDNDGPGDDIDHTVIGFNGGVMGRGLLLDGLGLDVGVGFDFLSVTSEMGDDDETDKGVQIVAFLGGTFVL